MVRLIFCFALLALIACKKPKAVETEVPAQDTTSMDTTAIDTIFPND